MPVNRFVSGNSYCMLKFQAVPDDENAFRTVVVK